MILESGKHRVEFWTVVKISHWPLAVWSFSMPTSKLDRHFYGYLDNKMATVLYLTLTVWKALLLTDLFYCQLSLTAKLWNSIWYLEHPIMLMFTMKQGWVTTLTYFWSCFCLHTGSSCTLNFPMGLLCLLTQF